MNPLSMFGFMGGRKMMVGMQTRMLNKKQQQGSPNWWWLDTHNYNNNNSDATRRSSWLQSTLSELDEKTTSMLKLIEADADSFAQRAEMYYRKRPDLIAVVEEFYRMHRSLAERFDHLKSDSAKRLLMTQGSPFSCNEQQVPPLKKSLSLSPGMYKYCDTCSDSSDDHEDNPESEVEDPEEDTGTEPTSLKDKSGGKPVTLDMESLTRGDANYEIWKLKEEVKRLREENRTLRDKTDQKDSENMQAFGRMSISMYEIVRQKDEMARHEEQKVEMIQELTMSTDEIKMLKKQNDHRRCEVACFDKFSEALNEIARFDEKSKMQRSGTSPKDNEGKKREATRPLSATPMDVPKEEENNPIQKKQARLNLGKSSDPVEPNTIQGGRFLRRLFPKSSKKFKATSALSFGTFH